MYSFNVTINAGTLTVVSMSNISFHANCLEFCLLAKIQVLLISSRDSWLCLFIVFWMFFPPRCFVGVQTDRSQVEGRLTEPDVESSACLSFLLLQHLSSIFLHRGKKTALFFPTVNNLPIGWRHCVHNFGVKINFPTSLSPKTS